jgi:hypothetical protein
MYQFLLLAYKNRVTTAVTMLTMLLIYCLHIEGIAYRRDTTAVYIPQ